MELAEDYPYVSYWADEGHVANCSIDASKIKIQVSQFYGISSEESMIDYVLSTGPLSICAASSDWNTYVDGILTSCSDYVDHCVQIVGTSLNANVPSNL
jgi:hypothetical protein